jgi:hypothetical protein
VLKWRVGATTNGHDIYFFFLNDYHIHVLVKFQID